MKLLKNKWFVLFLAILSLGLAVIMVPNVTDFGKNIMYIVTAIALLIYGFFYLLKNISKRSKENMTFWFEATELTLVFLIAIGLILVQFQVFQFSGVSLIVAFVVWMRGIAGAARSKAKFWPLVGFLFLITIGAYFFGKPLVGDTSILIAVAIIFIVLSLLCFIKFYELHKIKK